MATHLLVGYKSNGNRRHHLHVVGPQALQTTQGAGFREIGEDKTAADDWSIAISSSEAAICSKDQGMRRDRERGWHSASYLEQGSETLVADSLDKAVNHAIVHHGPLAVRVLDLSRSRCGHADHLSRGGRGGGGVIMVK